MLLPRGGVNCLPAPVCDRDQSHFSLALVRFAQIFFV